MIKILLLNIGIVKYKYYQMRLIEKKIREGFEGIKKYSSNLYAVIISIAIISWVMGVMGLIEYYLIDDKNPLYYLILTIIGFSVSYLNDGSLSELYNVQDNNTSNIFVPSVVGSHHRMYD